MKRYVHGMDGIGTKTQSLVLPCSSQRMAIQTPLPDRGIISAELPQPAAPCCWR